MDDRAERESHRGNLRDRPLPFNLLYTHATDEFARSLGYSSLTDMKDTIVKERIKDRVEYEVPEANWDIYPQPEGDSELTVLDIHRLADEMIECLLLSDISAALDRAGKLFGDAAEALSRFTEYNRHYAGAIALRVTQSNNPNAREEYMIYQHEALHDVLLGDPPLPDFPINHQTLLEHGFTSEDSFRSHILFRVVGDCLRGNWKRYEQYPYDKTIDTCYSYVQVAYNLAVCAHQYCLRQDEDLKTLFDTYFFSHSRLPGPPGYILEVRKELWDTAIIVYEKYTRSSIVKLIEEQPLRGLSPARDRASEAGGVVERSTAHERKAIKALIMKKISGSQILPDNAKPKDLLEALSGYYPLTMTERQDVRVAIAEYIVAEAQGAPTNEKAVAALERLIGDISIAIHLHVELLDFARGQNRG